MGQVVLFGDSITWGSADPIGGGWAGRLRVAGWNAVDRVNPGNGDYVTVDNCGISGDTVGGVLARFDVEAAARQPEVIVFAIGINDVPRDDLPGTPLDVLELQMEALLTAARAMADVVVVTATNVDETRSEHDYRNSDIALVNEVIRRTGAAARVVVVDVYGLLADADLLPDGLHPGPEGHQKMFDVIGPVVMSQPALHRFRTAE